MPQRPQIKPLGIGELEVLKQKLAKYEAGEISHIENVLAREFKSREHRRLRQFEETLALEEERVEENVRDLQSTERFELQNETQKTIQSETTFQAGAEVSGGFGPVKFSAYARYASAESTEESNRNSRQYAKEVTDKSLARLVEKVRQERITRTLEEVEEKNKHETDNRESLDHNVGIYRWVDQYNRALVVNYGRRLFYEFIVPEPAAFYLYAKLNNLEKKLLPFKPDKPTDPETGVDLNPIHVTAEAYQSLVAEYNVQGVEPPPAKNIIISKGYSAQFEDGKYFDFVIDDFELPKNYTAKEGFLILTSYGTDLNLGSGYINIGRQQLDFANYTPLFDLNDEVRHIPISVLGRGWVWANVVINLEVRCERTTESYDKWRLGTYTAIMAAYQKDLANYEEKISAFEIQQGFQYGSSNPAINRETEKEHLKKHCIEMWANWSASDAVGWLHHPGPPPQISGPPQIIISTALRNAETIRFLEEAFDWKNMTYEFYPFFYGGRSKWINLLSGESTDPLFENFLKAGAARVLVPVTPSYTEAVLWYQLTGEISNGTPVPALSTVSDPDVPLYNSYLSDMEDVEDLPEIDKDVDIDSDDPDTWLIKVPTTLVWLQQETHVLPDFESTT